MPGDLTLRALPGSSPTLVAIESRLKSKTAEIWRRFESCATHRLQFAQRNSCTLRSRSRSTGISGHDRRNTHGASWTAFNTRRRNSKEGLVAMDFLLLSLRRRQGYARRWKSASDESCCCCWMGKSQCFGVTTDDGNWGNAGMLGVGGR